MPADEKPCCPECALVIPVHLHQHDRPPTDIQDDEVLYRRFFVKGPTKDWKARGKQDMAKVFQLSNDSYNRSSLSNESDVLFDDTGHYFANAGILSVSIKQIRSAAGTYTLEAQGRIPARILYFNAIHDPMHCNYAHAQLEIWENGTRAPSQPSSMKTVFREMLSDNCKMIRDVTED
ncbi:hypothetical protein [Arsenicibacter rosenii]|uniref:Uncharacterized protein n=1 Tax=Arsenicibacter rosenii TaxID=1750698 RepID=A0A1S2VM51_9BACT|nr:hypothetical protein [Arsenicibacter rosenii]OIN59834.1 hypothetical protein BLX24_08220 [Arsenicibacter rosenii]